MKIDTLMINPGDAVYYSDSFRNVIEDHITALRQNNQTTVVDLVPGLAYKYEFDFYGLLQEYQIKPTLHWVTLRMNGFTSPTDYTHDVLQILIPNESVISQIRQAHTTTRTIT